MSFPFFRRTLTNQFDGLVVPEGRLFYPCCGDDTWDPIRMFADSIDEYHFVDIQRVPRFPHFDCAGESNDPRSRMENVSAKIVSDVSAPESKECPISDSTKAVLSRLGEEQWKYVRNEPEVVAQHLTLASIPPRDLGVFRYHQDGLAAFLELDKISVFFLRRDSMGEGGSGQMWFQPKLFDLILDKLVDGGLIVTDGSGSPFGHGRDGLAWSPLWMNARSRQGEEPDLPNNFTYAGRDFKCLGSCERGYGPVYAWQVSEARYTPDRTSDIFKKKNDNPDKTIQRIGDIILKAVSFPALDRLEQLCILFFLKILDEERTLREQSYALKSKKFGLDLLRSGYVNLDNDPRGPWKPLNIIMSTDRPKFVYAIKVSGGREYWPPQGKSWRFSQDTFQELMEDGRIWFGHHKNGPPKFKRYLSDALEAEQQRWSDNDPIFPRRSARYRWSYWKDMNASEIYNFVRDDVIPYMAALSREDSQVAEFFRDVKLTFENAYQFKQIINEIDKINFTELDPISQSGMMEYLLSRLRKNYSEERAGRQVPPHIRALMVEILNPEIGDTVFDPGCGIGEFLADSVEHLRTNCSQQEEVREIPVYDDSSYEAMNFISDVLKNIYKNGFLKDDDREDPGYGESCGKNRPQKSGDEDREDAPILFVRRSLSRFLEQETDQPFRMYGIEQSRQMLRIATVHLIMHGLRHVNLSLSNLDDSRTPDITRQFDCIISGPPSGPEIDSKNVTYVDLSSGRSGSETIHSYPFSHLLRALAPDGLAVFMIPRRLLMLSAGDELRQTLLEQYELRAVIDIPSGFFDDFLREPMVILTVYRPLESVVRWEDYPIVFAEIHNPRKDDTASANDFTKMIDLWRTYRNSQFESPPGVESEAVLPADSPVPLCWWTTAKKIRENGTCLSPDRYKPLIASRAPTESPAQLIDELIVLEREMMEGLMMSQKLIEELK